MIITNRYQEALLQTMDGIAKKHSWWSAPINFGGVPGPSGGTGTPAGGINGQLAQKYIAYDTTEAASNVLPSSGLSIVDNLNKIRYDITVLDGPKSDVTTQYVVIDDFTGESGTEFTLTHPLDTISGMSVFLDGTRKESDDYSVSDYTLTTDFTLVSGESLIAHYFVNTVTQATAQMTVLDNSVHVSSGVGTINFTGSGVTVSDGETNSVNVNVDMLEPFALSIENDSVELTPSAKVINLGVGLHGVLDGDVVTLSGALSDHNELINRFEDNAHPQYQLQTTLTTKGDMYAAVDYNNIVRFPLGNDGDILTVSDAESMGLKWIPASGITISGGGGSGDDIKVKVSSDDTTEGYLEEKLSAGAGITFTTLYSAGDEKLSIRSDGRSKISYYDLGIDYLEDKITAGSGITVTKTNPMGDEGLEISLDWSGSVGNVIVSNNDTTPAPLYSKLTPGSGIDINEINDGGNETLEIVVDAGSLNIPTPSHGTVWNSDSYVTVSGASDEFNDDSVDGKWSEFDLGFPDPLIYYNKSETEYGLLIYCNAASSSYNNTYALYQPFGSGNSIDNEEDFSITTKVSLAFINGTTTKVIGGIGFIGDTTDSGSEIYLLGLVYDGTLDSLKLDYNNISFGAAYSEANTMLPSIPLELSSIVNYIYLRFRYDYSEDDLFLDYSYDGISWVCFHTTSLPEADGIGLLFSSVVPHGAMEESALFSFFRHNTDCSLFQATGSRNNFTIA